MLAGRFAIADYVAFLDETEFTPRTPISCVVRDRDGKELRENLHLVFDSSRFPDGVIRVHGFGIIFNTSKGHRKQGVRNTRFELLERYTTSFPKYRKNLLQYNSEPYDGRLYLINMQKLSPREIALFNQWSKGSGDLKAILS